MDPTVAKPTAPAPSRMPPPPRYKMAVLTWLAVYPTLTVILAVLQPLGVLRTPLPLRTLIVTVILVPLVVYVLVPTLTRALAGWLQP